MVMAFSQCYGIAAKPAKDSSTVIITLQNAHDRLSKIDSVYVIFDRYDLRGAGVIKKIYYPDYDNQIHVGLPKGKYYVNIYCLGIYNKEGFDRIITAKANKKHNILLRLQQSDLYKQGTAGIPPEHFDPTHLAIMEHATRR